MSDTTTIMNPNDPQRRVYRASPSRVQIFVTVSVIVDVPILEQLVELKPRHPQNPACLIVSQRSGRVTLNRESFQSLAPGIIVGSEIIWQFDAE